MEQQVKILGSDLCLTSWEVTQQHISLLIISNSQIYSQGIQLLLERESANKEHNFRVVGNISPEEVIRLSEEGKLADFLADQPFELILLSTLPCSFALNLQTAEHLRRTWPGRPLLWLDMPDDSRKILSCIKSGGVGFIMENDKPAELYRGLVDAVKGERVCPPLALNYLFKQMSLLEQVTDSVRASTETSIRSSVLAELTPREIEVLKALMDSLTNREIATKLSIELRTVKNHVHNILHKLEVKNRKAAIIRALQLNAVSCF